MPIVPQFLLGAYLLFLVAAGWRLWTIGWSVRVKAATGLALVLPMPLLFLIPAAMHRDGAWSGLLMQLGFTLLVCGILCLAGGLSAARLRARRRK